MKSKTLSCERSVILKDITRFAPLWGVYLIGGLLVFLTALQDNSYDEAAYSIACTIGPFAVINMIYAALCAQLLFGDLFNARLCNALHAMPMRRESWFLSHAVSGLLFSLVPHLIAAPFLMIYCGQLSFVVLIWLLGMTMEFVFFYGLAILSVFCTGNRFAMIAVYGILNFASMIAWWFTETLFSPLMYGIVISEDIFAWLCPVAELANHSGHDAEDFVIMNRITTKRPSWRYQGLGAAWGYLIVLTVLGLVFMGLALLMYRRRALETAGDFVAVKALKPIFCVIVTLCAGCVFALFGEMSSSDRAIEILSLLIGLTVGFFAAQMMLQRNVKVFRGKTFLRLGILLLVMVVSLAVVGLDPFGVISWVPEADDVAFVEIDNSYRIYSGSNQYLRLEDPEQVQAFIQVHEEILEERQEFGRSYTIRYTMMNGREVIRQYALDDSSTAYRMLKKLYQDSASYMGYNDWEAYKTTVSKVEFDGINVTRYLEREDIEKLAECIRADVEAGAFDGDWDDGGSEAYVGELVLYADENAKRYCVYTGAQYTCDWLKDHVDQWGISYDIFG